MVERGYLKPLPKRHRRYTFLLLLLLFVVSIPFLILYATGYRLDFSTERANLVSTGGIFIGAERTGSEIFIDGELVRETRVFRRAFYAQNLNPGTHRVHVQRPLSHTWVKELPVYEHLVTEAQAFNLPMSPQARVITQFQSATGTIVLPMGSTLIASTTQNFRIATTTATTTLVAVSEFKDRETLFRLATTTAPASILSPFVPGPRSTTTATTSVIFATTTKEQGGVRLFERGEDVYALWAGSRENMPYYYCAEPFEPLATTTFPMPPLFDPSTLGAEVGEAIEELEELTESKVLDNPIQQVPPDTECVPEIRIDRKGEKVTYFDFFPGSTDLVLMVLEHGVFAVEVDDRAWQNVQSILLGEGLDARVDGGRVYIRQKGVIYEMILE